MSVTAKNGEAIIAMDENALLELHFRIIKVYSTSVEFRITLLQLGGKSRELERKSAPRDLQGGTIKKIKNKNKLSNVDAQSFRKRTRAQTLTTARLRKDFPVLSSLYLYDPSTRYSLTKWKNRPTSCIQTFGTKLRTF